MNSTDAFHGFSRDFFRFFEELGETNTREWFHDNKKRYEDDVRQPFLAFLDVLSAGFAKSGLALTANSKTMFRINRDVRFSKDKRPYNTHMSVLASPSGTKDELGGVFYLRMDAHGGYLGGGFYRPASDRLKSLRTAIADDADGFLKIAAGLESAGMALRSDESLKRIPRGFEKMADSAIEPYLKMKSLTAMAALPREAWLDIGIVDKAVDDAVTVVPFLDFARAALELEPIRRG